VQPSPAGRDEAASSRRRQSAAAIERAAIDLFLTNPYEQVTAQQVAAASGVSIRTFYRYFATKDDILLALPKRYAARIAERTASRPGAETAFAAMRAAIDELSVVYDDELNRWQDAVTRAHAANRMSTLVVSVTGPLLSDALAQRSRRDRRGLDEGWTELAGAAIATALVYGARRWALAGGSLRTHILAAVDFLGDGLDAF